MAELGKIGMGGTYSIEDVRERLESTLRVLRSQLPEEQAKDIAQQILEVWRG